METNFFITVNTNSVIYDLIEGEIILLNLKTGFYYSLTGTGAYIWKLLVRSVDPDVITDILFQKYRGNRDKIYSSLVKFIEELLKEDLVIKNAESFPVTVDNQVAFDYLSVNELKFTQPVLNKYSDMKDALLTKPDHDLDESGWPMPVKLRIEL